MPGNDPETRRRKRREYQRRWRQSHPEQSRDRDRLQRKKRGLEGRCVMCGGTKDPSPRVTCQVCRLRSSQARRRLALEYKLKLGGRCSVPGCGVRELDLLEFDHVNDDAWEHYLRYCPNSKIKPGMIGLTMTMIRKLLAGTDPTPIQLLCRYHNKLKAWSRAVREKGMILSRVRPDGTVSTDQIDVKELLLKSNIPLPGGTSD